MWVQPTASDVLSVQHSPGRRIPEFCQAPEEGTKRPSSIDAEQARDVLIDHVAGAELLNQSEIHKGEVAPWIFESASKPGDAESLAGWTACDEVHISS
jgi:hypothetical protein